MTYFNIDFNKFRPSTKLKEPSATPTVQQRLDTNLQRLNPQYVQPTMTSANMTPVPQPIPTKSPSPVSEQIFQNDAVKNYEQQHPFKTGWGKVSNALNKPSEWIQSLLTKGKTYEEAYTDPTTPFSKINTVSRNVSPLNLIPGYKKKQDEKWDKAMQNETAKKIGGSAMRMVADPLNFLPFDKIFKLAGKGISKVDDVVGVSKFADKVMDYARKTPNIYKPIEKVAPYFRVPKFGELMKTTEKTTNKRLNDLYKLVKKTADNLSPAEQARVGQLLEGGIDTSTKYEKLAKPLRELTEQIGQEAVNLGILSKKSFAKYKGVYMKHLFEKYFDDAVQQGFMSRTAPKIGEQFAKKRKGAEGFIREFSAPTFAGLGSGIKDIESAKFYKTIANDFSVGTEVVKKGRKIINRIVPEGYQYAPHAIKNSKVAKLFKNKALPSSIIDYINRTADAKKVTGWDDLLTAWKKGKTIYNPAYHVRNLISNQILSDMSTGRGVVQTVSDYVGAVKQYMGKGGQKFVNAAEDIGLIKQKNFGAALDEFLDISEITQKNGFAKADNFLKGLQNVSEETAKLNVFQTWVKKLAKTAGKSVDDALKDPDLLVKASEKAEEAIFSPYRISQAERGLVKNAVPFYSFTRQVVPFTAKTLVTNPGRIAKYGKLKREVENFSEGGQRPAYAENFVRLPFKNKKGENMYFDPNYIYPFSNAFSPLGNDTGMLPFGLGTNPIVTELAAQAANKDFYYNQPIEKYESEGLGGKKIMDRASHAFRTFSPQFLNNLVSKVFPAVTGKPDYAGRERNLSQAIIDTFAGIKTSFIGSQKGSLDDLYMQNKINRSKQNDISKILNDNSLSESQKRNLIEKALK